MERPSTKGLRIGEWCVHPKSGQISRNGETARLEERAMRLLLCLAEHAGEVVSIDDLLNQAWSGVIVTPDSVYQAVASLRRQLGDDPKQPAYIATVPRLGYRMVADVAPLESESQAPEPTSAPSHPPQKSTLKWVALAAIILVAAAGFIVLRKIGRAPAPAVAAPPQKSVAVLPFLDLTEKMAEEEFADGMTEELIDRLNKIPGIRAPAPSAVFYYKNKHISVTEIAKALHVTYVLDGSTRKSGARLRVAARLTRAGDGNVIWSETYDRPWGDILTVQDDIAGEVTKALQASIEPTTGAN